MASERWWLLSLVPVAVLLAMAVETVMRAIWRRGRDPELRRLVERYRDDPEALRAMAQVIREAADAAEAAR